MSTVHTPPSVLARQPTVSLAHHDPCEGILLRQYTQWQAVWFRCPASSFVLCFGSFFFFKNTLIMVTHVKRGLRACRRHRRCRERCVTTDWTSADRQPPAPSPRDTCGVFASHTHRAKDTNRAKDVRFASLSNMKWHFCDLAFKVKGRRCWHDSSMLQSVYSIVLFLFFYGSFAGQNLSRRPNTVFFFAKSLYSIKKSNLQAHLTEYVW